MKWKSDLIIIILITSTLTHSCGQIANTEAPEQTPMPIVMVAEGSNQIIHHKAYTLSYNEEHEQADWVAYMLTRERVNGHEPRSNDFREDPSVTTQSAQLEDYYRSGYSRGHLAPAGDMKWDPTAMSESFLMSNMSPQESRFNDGIWNSLENKVRHWARYYDTIFVVTGPVLEEGLPTIGRNRVSVPHCYYKVIYVPDRQMMIGFLVTQDCDEKRLSSLAVSVDEVEQATGLNFFPTLGEEMETECNIKQWKW